MLRLSALFALVVLLAGCDSSAPIPTDVSGSTLHLEGALEADFQEAETFAAIVGLEGEAQTYHLEFRARREARGDERIRFSTSLRLDGPLTPGRYVLSPGDGDGDEVDAGLTYQLDRSPDERTMHRLRGTSVQLTVDRVDGDVIAGELRVITEQVEGQRITHGQREEVTLLGPVNVVAVFEAEIAE